MKRGAPNGPRWPRLSSPRGSSPSRASNPLCRLSVLRVLGLLLERTSSVCDIRPQAGIVGLLPELDGGGDPENEARK